MHKDKVHTEKEGEWGMVLTQDVTATDMFCGCGGSSDAARRANRGNRRVRIKYAINHWARAIETHNSNFPDTSHVLTDINETQPEHFEPTTLLIASPECINHALAKGKRRKNLNQLTLPLNGEEEGGSLIVEAEERSRCTMWDPQRWARVQKFEYIILENVVDVRFWSHYETWRKAWANLDKNLSYEYQEVYLNSMFFWPCPQSRDRWYFVAWRKGNRPPNLNFTPLAFCGHCQQQVYAVQVWKNPQKKWGRYKRQYLYHCPRCNIPAFPFYFAAANAINWSLPIQRIGDRKKPLRAKTLRRIEVGLEKFLHREPFTVQVNKTSDRVKSVITDTFPTQTADNGLAIVEPFLLNLNHDHARPVSVMEETFPTQTSYDSRGLVIGPQRPLQVDLTGEYRVRDSLDPCSTVVGGGNHQGMLVPPGAEPFIAELHGTSLAHGVSDPLATVCAGGRHHGLVIPQMVQGMNAWLMTYYSNGQLQALDQAVPTVTTKHRCALLTSEEQNKSTLSLEDCGFRMLQPEEIKAAMAFFPEYIITGNRREQVRQLGNAVTPPVMQWLIERVLDALA